MKAGVASFYWSHLSTARCVLDLGCGFGDLGLYKPEAVKLLGLDINPNAAKQATGYHCIQVWDLDTDAPLPFEDNRFGGIVAKDIFEHLWKPRHAVAEMYRVLRPGGLVLASVPVARAYRVWDDYTHVRGFTARALRQMFLDGGFEVIAIWRMGGVPLMSRLNLIRFIPYILCLPLFDWLWASSHEIKARKPIREQ